MNSPHQKSKLEVNYSFLLSKGLLRSYSTESSLNAIPAATPIYQQSNNPLLLEKGQGELRVSSRSASSAERPFKCGTGNRAIPDAVRIYQESEHKLLLEPQRNKDTIRCG